MLDRRTFLAAAAVSVVATESVLAVGAVNPDAELLALGAEYSALRSKIDAAWKARQYDTPEFEAMSERASELTDQIKEALPVTVAGLAVQLRVIWEWTSEDADEIDGPTENSDGCTKLLWRVMKQAECMAGTSA